MKRYAIAFLLLGSLVTACNDDQDGKTIMTETIITESLPGDSLYAQASRDSMNQVAAMLGNLYSTMQMDSALNSIAEKQVNAAEVKKFISMVKADQAIIRKEIIRIAAVKNVTISGYKNAGLETTENEWKNSATSNFDTLYINYTIQNLQSKLNTLQSDSVNRDTDVKYFTAKTIPYLRKHLEQARSIKIK